MKILSILILSLIFTISGTAQQTTWQRIDRPIGIILYHTATIAIGAIGDAQYDMGNKNVGHMLKAAEVATLLSGPFVFGIDKRGAASYLLSYCFLRFSFFDSFYNMTRDLPLLYNGTTSGYDKFMSQMPPHGRAWSKSISLIAGVAIPIKHL